VTRATMRAAKPKAPAPLAAGVITSLAAAGGRTDRVAVRIGGARAFDLAAAVVEQAGLHVGDLLSEDKQADLIALDAPFRARDKALRLLASRDRSRHEVEDRLKASGFSADVVSDTVAWLLDLGYLDDERFAASYSAERLRGGCGPRRVRSELLRKGVEQRLVDEVLHSIDEETQTAEGLEAAIALARRRFGEQFGRDPSAGRRLAGFLARRGYDWDVITAVTRTFLAEAGTPEAGSDFDTAGD